METIIGGGQVGGKVEDQDNKIKCFIMSSGFSIITKYEEVETEVNGEKEIELYFLNPMVSNFARMPDNRIQVIMSPLVIFSKDSNRVGPINPFAILVSHEIEARYSNMYESKVVEMREARLGLVSGGKVNMDKLKKQLKIGEGLKIK